MGSCYGVIVCVFGGQKAVPSNFGPDLLSECGERLTVCFGALCANSGVNSSGVGELLAGPSGIAPFMLLEVAT